MKARLWRRSRRNQVILVLTILVPAIFIIVYLPRSTYLDLDIAKRYIENSLEEALKEDKGTGCVMTDLDPFAPEIMKFDEQHPKITCPGLDWVKCYISQCRVLPQILQKIKDIKCEYRDIIYENDKYYFVSNSSKVVYDDDVHQLIESDHVRIECSGIDKERLLLRKWQGLATGFRTSVARHPPPAGREDTLNVLIFGFDSTSRLGFIRKMPHSYKFLKDELQATFLTSYNVLGDGTPAALFPILTGSTELELPEARKSITKDAWIDHTMFIFHKLRLDGYRTAYFEDRPEIGTFQYRFNGFNQRPADHYLWDFYKEVEKIRRETYCVGDTPQYKLMMNVTEQFFKLDGKKYCFTFVVDITHDDFNEIASADDDFVLFLTKFRDDGHLQDTLVFVMGDHGTRFSDLRQTYQGKLEERLPLMAVILPEQLKARRSDAQIALNANAQVLTTAHDVYATILDALKLAQYKNPYKVKGADLERGLTLLKPIPPNRSCSEAGIETHWCACHRWTLLPLTNPMVPRVAQALVDYINELTLPVRKQCEERNLLSVTYIKQRQVSKRLLEFHGTLDADGYLGKFTDNKQQVDAVGYQIQICVSPGKGIYEATVTYIRSKNKIVVNSRDISRINAYGKQPECISHIYPHLNKYCYCKNS